MQYNSSTLPKSRFPLRHTSEQCLYLGLLRNMVFHALCLPFAVCWSWVTMELLLNFGSTRLGNYPSHSNSLTYGPTFSWLYQHPLTSQAMRLNIIIYIANHQRITYLHIVLQFMLRPIQRPLVFIICHL